MALTPRWLLLVQPPRASKTDKQTLDNEHILRADPCPCLIPK